MNHLFKILQYHCHKKGIISIQVHESLTLRSICPLNVDFIYYGHSKTRTHCLLEDTAELNNVMENSILHFLYYTNQTHVLHCKESADVSFSQTFLTYLFFRFAVISYGRFIAVCFGFYLSTYVQNRC